MAAGELTGEHADIIAAAAEQTDGAAAQDQDFIEQVAAADADQAARIARDYITRHTDAAKAQSRHDRQRCRRSVSRFLTDDHLDADPDVIGALYGRAGHPLWWGRTTRFATETQHLALITRDKGCVCCGKHHLHCQAHHLEPWNAPIRGHTDITKLALLCSDCHHELHADNLTLYQHTDHTWRTRPATPNETPPQPLNPRRK